MKKSICIISLSNLSRDGRVLRQIDYLSREYDLTVIGYGPAPQGYAGTPYIRWQEISLPRQAAVRSASTITARLLQIPFFPRTHPAYRIALDSQSDAYHANNWDSLPIAALAARKNGSKLVLDIHESYDSWYWGLSTGIVKYVLKKYSPYVHASTTVVNQLADQHRKFGLDPIVLMNAPALSPVKIPLRKTDPHKIRLIHHGVASPTRRTDLMIKTIAQCDVRYELHLVFTNLASAYVTRLRRLADQIAPGRVIFHPAFSPREIVQEIANYDVGFFPLPPTNYNYIITLPNKFFEFIAAGLAVCIGPSLSMAEIVKNYGCGVVAASFEPAVLAGVLNQTTAVEWDEMRQASLRAAQLLNADVEMGKLSQIYHELLT
jgi:glycosyltransferase involved in cell wall biosynthesis